MSERRKIPINNHDAGRAGARDAARDGGRSSEPAPDAPTPDAPTGAAPTAEAPTGDTAPGAAARQSAAGPDAAAPDAPPRSGAADHGTEPPSDRAVDVVSVLEAVTAERDAYLDSLRRLQAEFDNFRRRSQRESGEARTRARCGLLSEFLPVFDNLARALDAAEHHEEGKVLEGVRLTHSLFADLLRREGVEEISPLGAPFDPHLHEAVMSLPSDEEEGVVVRVLEKGYVAGETVLRPARVAVSAGGRSAGGRSAGDDAAAGGGAARHGGE